MVHNTEIEVFQIKREKKKYIELAMDKEVI
jgi:hypothetical protein